MERAGFMQQEQFALHSVAERRHAYQSHLWRRSEVATSATIVHYTTSTKRTSFVRKDGKNKEGGEKK